MARRRKITAPSADDLTRYEEEFRRETADRSVGPNAAIAPIATVARQAAEGSQPLPPDIREAQARDHKDAERLRAAEADGLVMLDVPLDRIDDSVMVRDRMVFDATEMEELKRSILNHGLRLPVEIYDQGDQERRFALISGYRRLRAVRELHAATHEERFATIRAVLRDPEEMGGAIVAMVEENEIRAQLTHYERGRIAVISAQQGSFATTEDAVASLFASASKAKRSKIRSFALIYEELGDMLEHADGLKEKDGLRLANVLRHGAEPDLREALEAAPAGNAAEEWALIEPVVIRLETPDRPKRSGGRPRTASRNGGWRDADETRFENGITLQSKQEGDALLLRLSGKALDHDGMDAVIVELTRLLDQPR